MWKCDSSLLHMQIIYAVHASQMPQSSIRANDPRYAKQLELRRVKLTALREEEAERVRKQRMQEAAVRAQRDARADEARGPPPPPSDGFRLPQRLVADALAAWEVTQVRLEVVLRWC